MSQGEEILFDLHDEPGELRNRGKDGGPRLETLRREAESILQAGTRPDQGESTLEMDEVMTKRLQDLGYL